MAMVYFQEFNQKIIQKFNKQISLGNFLSKMSTNSSSKFFRHFFFLNFTKRCFRIFGTNMTWCFPKLSSRIPLTKNFPKSFSMTSQKKSSEFFWEKYSKNSKFYFQEIFRKFPWKALDEFLWAILQNFFRNIFFKNYLINSSRNLPKHSSMDCLKISPYCSSIMKKKNHSIPR